MNLANYLQFVVTMKSQQMDDIVTRPEIYSPSADWNTFSVILCARRQALVFSSLSCVLYGLFKNFTVTD